MLPPIFLYCNIVLQGTPIRRSLQNVITLRADVWNPPLFFDLYIKAAAFR